MKNTKLGKWKYHGDTLDAEDRFGFVYIVTDKLSGEYYIGIKQMKRAIKRPPLKGKKRVRRDVVESRWREYCTSSREICERVEADGIERFEWEILRFCDSKSELKYYEAKKQFDLDVLLDPKSLNGIINLRIGKIKINEKRKV